MNKKKGFSKEEAEQWILNNLDFWADEAIFEHKLGGSISREVVKKLILFGCYTVASKLEE